MKRHKEHKPPPSPPELPEAKPLPYEANPGGTEGVNPGWPGGSSGVITWPEPEGDTTYSTEDVPLSARREVVRAILCEKCGQNFPTQALLNIHLRTAHRPRA